MRPTILVYGAGLAACAFAYAWADDLVSPRAIPGEPGIDRPIQTAAAERALPQTAPAQAEPAPSATQKTAAAASDTAVADAASATTTPLRIPDPLKALQSAVGEAAPKAVMDWKSGAMILSRSGRSTLQAVDQISIGLNDAIRTRMAAPIFSGPPSQQVRPIPVGYARTWPAALSLKAGRYDLELSPHASVRMTGLGREAEAGGVLRFGPAANPDRRRPLLRQGRDQSTVGSGRWFLFAAASGRAVSWRTLRQTIGGERPWTPSDNSSAFVTSSQAGVAWNYGPIQTSFAIVRRRTKTGAGLALLPSSDSIVTFSISLKPMG